MWVCNRLMIPGDIVYLDRDLPDVVLSDIDEYCALCLLRVKSIETESI